MAASASLALLKGMTDKKTEEAPLNGATPPPIEDDETVTVDVDKMDSKAIDKLVEELDLPVPDGWAKMAVAKKRAWLKEHSEGEVPEEQAEEQPEENVYAGDQEDDEVGPGETVAGPGDQVEQEVLPPTKNKPKKTGAALAKIVASGEIIPPNELTDAVNFIENLNEKVARSLVETLAESAEFTYFKLGGVLSVIQDKNWYSQYGYGTFKEYMEKECGIAYRRGMYWIEIYKYLAEASIPWEKVKSLGWMKMAVIARILTVENVEGWVSLAEGQTVLQLQESVKTAKASGGDPPSAMTEDSSETHTPEITTKTFKVHADQKKTIDAALVKAKAESSPPTTFDTVALEMICLDYLGAKASSLAEQLAKVGVKAAMDAFEEAFPDADINVELPVAAE